MRRPGLDHCGRGTRSATALIAIALVLPGCSSSSGGSSDPPLTSRFSNLFSSSTPAPAPTPVAATPAAPTFNPEDCPTADIRSGAGTLAVPGQNGDTSPTGVRYQLSFDRLARQCTLVGTNLLMKIGVQGRIVVGPTGGPGEVNVPLRYAVVKEGPEPKTIVTKFKRFAVNVTSSEWTEFSDVADDLSFPLPSSQDLEAYVVYVGFDELGDAAEKKPAKKPAPKRK